MPRRTDTRTRSGRLRNAAAVDVLDAHDEAVGFLALLAQGHEA